MRQFNWRMILIRVLVYALTLMVISLLLPEIYFADRRLLNVLFLAVMLGLLIAFVKPILQFLTLPFIFATYGLVVVGINAFLLILLAVIFPERFVVGGLVWAIIGGALMGLFASILESLFGLNLPIGVKSDPGDIYGDRPVSRSSPVERRLLEGLDRQEEAEPAGEEEMGPATAEGAAELEEVPVETKPGTRVAPGEAESDDSSTQPGDEQ